MGWLQRIFGTTEQPTERRAQAFVAELSVAQAALRAGLAEMRVTTGEGRVTTEGPRFGSSVGAVRQLGGRFWVDGAFGYSLVLFNDRHVDGAREPNSEALSGLWSARLALRYTAGH